MRSLPFSLFFAFLSLAGASGMFAAVLNVRAFGATGDGRTLDTVAINRAIEAAAANGGGTVVFPAGDYLCRSIRLKSHITLELGAGATIIAADPPPVGQPGGYDAPEPNEWTQFQDFGHSHWRNSLIWGEDLENIAITGAGRIYGRGLSRGNGRIALPVGVQLPLPPDAPPPDVLEADGEFEILPRPDLTPGPFGYPNARDTQAAGGANKAIALKNCRNVTLRDFTVLHGGHFAVLATGVDNLTIDNLLVDTNRDGIDLDNCSNVRLTNTAVNSPWDDGICLKSSFALGVKRITENVMIANCFVSGFDEGTLLDGTRQRKTRSRGGAMGRIKLGTESAGGFRNITITNCVFEYCRGLALEQVDGGVMENITVSNLTLRDVQNAPIFIRLGARLRSAAPGTSRVSRILISHVVAHNVAPEHGIIIAGLPGQTIDDVALSNLQIYYRGGGTAEQAKRQVPEFEKDYPDPYNFGTMPSWGLFARHAKNLSIRHVDFHLLALDQRPAVILDDVSGARLSDIQLPSRDTRSWRVADVTGLRVRDCAGLPDSSDP